MAAITHHPASARSWLVLGCGYTGQRLARRLREGKARVAITSREAAKARELAAAIGGVAGHALDLQTATSEALAAAIERQAVVVHSAPPRDDGGEGERRLAQACADAGARRIVYLSSTGVYPHGQGAWVDEDTPVAPTSERGARRLRAETALLERAAELGVEAVALRIAAIYGPGRGVAERLRAGTYRIVGAGDAYVSRVHVDDLVSAIVRAGTADHLPRPVYTVADDAPMTSRAYADALAEILDLPAPPSVPADQVDPSVRAMLASDRKVSSRRLREELGVAFRYPDGVAGAVASVTEPRSSR
jgi:nucleoside-diphosphate-sugar epimerase